MKPVSRRTPHSYWWSLGAIGLLVIALSIITTRGFRISERPSLLNYPILSAVQEIREEAIRVQNHMEKIARDQLASDQPVPWDELAAAVWHLDIMLGDHKGVPPMAAPEHADPVFLEKLEAVTSRLSAYQTSAKTFTGIQKAGYTRQELFPLEQRFEEFIHSVDSLEAYLIQRVDNERLRFRQTIIGMTAFSLVLVVIAGILFLRFERQQFRIRDLLEMSRDELEAQVARRTQMLSQANDRLLLEIDGHKQAEQKLLRYQEQLRRVASELLQTQERERRRIATEIHDRIGQALAVAKIQLGALKAVVDDPSQVGAVDDIRDLVTRTIQDTRTLTFELSPPVLYEMGLQAAVEWLVERLQVQSGISIRVTGDPDNEKLEISRRVFLFQAIRELLFNVVKHADARTIEVTIVSGPERVDINVKDDGGGCEPLSKTSQDRQQDHGFGLFSIREQLRYYGGELTMESENGKGTRVTIRMPLEPHR